MRYTSQRFRAWTLSAALAAALGTGAAAALARPADAQEPGSCNSGQCRRNCVAAGADGGSCVGGSCICFIQAR
jgi:hypothetical protein